MTSQIMNRRTVLSAALVLAASAGPAGSVELAGSAWETSGRSVSKVKGIGKAKRDADLTLSFFIGSFVRVEDAFEREFTGSYAVLGRKRNKADLVLGVDATATLEGVIESQIEDAVLQRTGEDIAVDVDIMTVSARAKFNGKGTKMRFRLKATAFGSADLDPRRRRTTYTVRTKGARTF